MASKLRQKLYLYQLTAALGIVFALVGFSYNVWRMEVSEENSNTRMACFEILTELAALEQVLYVAHYDKDIVAGSPRKAWVKVGLIRDLSALTADDVEKSANHLHQIWSNHAERVIAEEASVARVVAAVDEVRQEIKILLKTLH